MPLKPLDVVTALALLHEDSSRWTVEELGERAGIGRSEAGTSSGRLVEAGLCNAARGRFERPQLIRKALLEFLVHGVRYAFYAAPGSVTRGVATGVSAPPLADQLQIGPGQDLVWPDAKGEHRGQSITPLHPRVPDLARRDPALHQLLALIDGLRCGAARERALSAQLLEERVAGPTRMAP